ncbi:2-oxoglutarate dehydrogenase E1 component [Caldithrix abyssi]
MIQAIDYLDHIHSGYLESLYEQFKKNPSTLDESWQRFFEGFELGQKTDVSTDGEQLAKEFKVIELINAYRTRGHLFTRTNPVRQRRKYRPTLDIENFGLSKQDLKTVFHAGELIGIGAATLEEILQHLNHTYCRSVGAEFMFIRVPERVQWLRERMESTRNEPDLSIEDKKQILQKLNEALVFETFLHKRYLGQKRFSLQGSETLIPGLDFLIEYGAELGVEEFVIGMAHRGRLNVLANILEKTYEEIFAEFEDFPLDEGSFSGDVKYHLGYTSLLKTKRGKQVKVSLSPNPSHLEAVDPVIEGMARAGIDEQYNGNVNKIVPILIHGDAAIAGQGVVYEVIQMSLLEGYATGGTIHLVINNQLGFTTSYLEGRSSTYCTDVAKVTLSPVFHVNADDAEAVVHVIRLAMEYRQKFHTDVFIDLLGYRRYGHNEGDEPRFTQPKLYQAIANHPDPRTIYYQKLLKSSEVERGLAEKMEREFQAQLQEKLNWVRDKKAPISTIQKQKSNSGQSRFSLPNTGVPLDELKTTAERIFRIPKQLNPLPKILKIYDERQRRFAEGMNIDWGMAEALAFGTLVHEKIPVRLSGQDSVRGTFAHRHAAILSQDDEEQYIPLQHVSEDQAPFYIYNSPLSEYAVMGFEFGYSCARPNALTIWEAQYGDFANGAQIVIDEFIASSAEKWNKANGLVLFLPHGYEGHGPDHSSARIERFLLLAAKHNMRIVNCTTPANFFHLLRSQVKLDVRSPLIVFTPKSLLRHPQCVSSLKEFTTGTFKTIIDDAVVDRKKVTRAVLCSGKFYYDINQRRQEVEDQSAAVIRLEQIYPFPKEELERILKRYSNLKEVWWAQEEPENAGALWFIERELSTMQLKTVSRPASAAPATGSHLKHVQEQNALLEKIFNKEE